MLGSYLKKNLGRKEWEFGNSFIWHLGQRVNEQGGEQLQGKGGVAPVVHPSLSG